MNLSKTARKIVDYQIVFPSAMTVFLIAFHVVGVLDCAWLLIFLPVLVSTSVGLVMLAALVAVSHIRILKGN